MLHHNVRYPLRDCPQEMKFLCSYKSEVTQSCPTLCDLMDCSLKGSSVHGLFQARVLEWGAIAFSRVYFLVILLNSTRENP